MSEGAGGAVTFCAATITPATRLSSSDANVADARLPMLYTLFVVLRTPRLIGKWFWAILVLFGVGQIALNWTTNAFTASVMNLHLFGSGFIKANQYSPLFLITSIPLGAILFYVMRATSLQAWTEEEMADGKG